MLEETVQQANHVFYLPTRPSDTPLMLKPPKKEQLIIMSEMANAVICPDTGKSLKHSGHDEVRWFCAVKVFRKGNFWDVSH
jgi:hypothetical protein